MRRTKAINLSPEALRNMQRFLQERYGEAEDLAVSAQLNGNGAESRYWERVACRVLRLLEILEAAERIQTSPSLAEYPTMGLEALASRTVALDSRGMPCL